MEREEEPEIVIPAAYLEVVRTAMEAGPEAVLQLYLAWDTAGYRFSRDGHGRALYEMSCFLPNEDCFSPEPGWDFVLVVRGYSWKPTFVSSDSAVFAVVYDQVGHLPGYANRDFQPNPPDTVRVRRMEEGWFLARFITPHVSLNRALEFSLSASDTTLVRQWQESGRE